VRKYSKEQAQLTNSYQEQSSYSKEKINRSVDHKKIDGLYNDYKKQIQHRVQLKEDLHKVIYLINYKEQGITFKPNLTSSPNYLIQTTFKERNNTLLENRRRTLEEYNYNLTKSSEFENKKKYSPQELSEINSEIIKRLYVRELDKVYEKNQTTPMQYTGQNKSTHSAKVYKVVLSNENGDFSSHHIASTDNKLNVSDIEELSSK